MPNYREPDLELIDNLVDNGGVAKETKNKRKVIRTQFDDYLMKYFDGHNLEDLWDSPDMEEKTKIDKFNLALCGFFQTMTVKSKSGEMAPKKNTADSAKSHLKKIFLDVTDLDITSSEFKKFNVST